MECKYEHTTNRTGASRSDHTLERSHEPGTITSHGARDMGEMECWVKDDRQTWREEKGEGQVQSKRRIGERDREIEKEGKGACRQLNVSLGDSAGCLFVYGTHHNWLGQSSQRRRTMFPSGASGWQRLAEGVGGGWGIGSSKQQVAAMAAVERAGCRSYCGMHISGTAKKVIDKAWVSWCLKRPDSHCR